MYKNKTQKLCNFARRIDNLRLFAIILHIVVQVNDYKGFVIGMQKIEDEKTTIQDKITRVGDNGR